VNRGLRGEAVGKSPGGIIATKQRARYNAAYRKSVVGCPERVHLEKLSDLCATERCFSTLTLGVSLAAAQSYPSSRSACFCVAGGTDAGAPARVQDCRRRRRAGACRVSASAAGRTCAHRAARKPAPTAIRCSLAGAPWSYNPHLNPTARATTPLPRFAPGRAAHVDSQRDSWCTRRLEGGEPYASSCGRARGTRQAHLRSGAWCSVNQLAAELLKSRAENI